MPRRSPFLQSDVTRALKAVQAAGCDVQRVEIDAAGKLTVWTGTPTTDPATANPCDELLR